MLLLSVLVISLFTLCDLTQIHLEKLKHCTETSCFLVDSYLRVKRQNFHLLHRFIDLKLVV